MRTHLLNLWDTLRTSYWFIPSLCAAAALSLSIVMPRVDAFVYGMGIELPEWVLTTTETARATLSAMAGAMVAVTGTVFSITIVTLSLTSQQFGPRLLRRFMHDLTTQWTLGVFVSTGFYCLLLLRTVEQHEDGIVAPHLSIMAAVLLAVLSMAMLIVFIHHVAVMIQAPQVVAAVAKDLDDAIVRLFPQQLGEGADESPPAEAAREPSAPASRLHARLEGYVQAIDEEGVMRLAQDEDLVLRLRARPRDFVVAGDVLAEAWPGSSSDAPLPAVGPLEERLNELIIVGARRTPRQDVGCAIDELTEVAVRALSPGINDPYTAMNCVDRLGASLGRLAQRRLPSPLRCDADGRLRVIATPVTFAEALRAAFDPIRHHACRSVPVTLRMLEALVSIASRIRRPADCEAVRLQAELSRRIGGRFADARDRAAVESRCGEVLAVLQAR